MLKRTEVIGVRETYQGKLLLILAQFLRFPLRHFSGNPLYSLNGVTDFSEKKFQKYLNMSSIQSDTAKHHCIYTQGAAAFHTLGLF